MCPKADLNSFTLGGLETAARSLSCLVSFASARDVI